MSAPTPLIVLPPLRPTDPPPRPRWARNRRRNRAALTWGLRVALCLGLASLGAGLALAAGALPPAPGGTPGTVAACALDIGAPDALAEDMRPGGALMTVPGPLIRG
ncbi:hypothetical protein KUV28_13590 [Ferrimonas balearica]|nr:hypothetical protein [Ferrimonas balearica]